MLVQGRQKNGSLNGKAVHLGSFANYDDAVAARKAAATEAYGEFSRTAVPPLLRVTVRRLEAA
jgi:hypothetical protein